MLLLKRLIVINQEFVILESMAVEKFYENCIQTVGIRSSYNYAHDVPITNSL